MHDVRLLTPPAVTNSSLYGVRPSTANVHRVARSASSARSCEETPLHRRSVSPAAATSRVHRRRGTPATGLPAARRVGCASDSAAMMAAMVDGVWSGQKLMRTWALYEDALRSRAAKEEMRSTAGPDNPVCVTIMAPVAS